MHIVSLIVHHCYCSCSIVFHPSFLRPAEPERVKERKDVSSLPLFTASFHWIIDLVVPLVLLAVVTFA